MKQGTTYKDMPEVEDVIKPYLCKERKIMAWDGYNHRFPKDQRVCGTVLPRFAINAPKNGYKIVKIEDFTYKIRKLTPRECFRLMGVSDSDIDKIRDSDVSKSQQYKLAGNSIVVDVMVYIFSNLFADRLTKAADTSKITPPNVKYIDNKSKGNQTDKYLRIPQATAKGYIEVPPYSIFDGSYPESKTRRGRLQEGGRVAPTLTCNGNALFYYEGYCETHKKNENDT